MKKMIITLTLTCALGLSGVARGEGSGALESHIRTASVPSFPVGERRQWARDLAHDLTVVITFRHGNDRLEPHFNHKIRWLNNTLHHFPDLRVHLSGHADPQADPWQSMLLSGRRLEAVRQALVANGLDPQRIDTAAFGESQPVAGESNRRVVVRLSMPLEVEL